jgi:HK97 family phage prohead protease
MKISRYPIVFNARSVDLGGFIEVIRPGAVDRILREHADVVALKNHDSNMPLGRVSAGTVALVKTSFGLRADVEIDPAVSYAADLAHNIERGDAKGGSFAFRAIDDAFSLTPDGIVLRELLDMDVREVSLGVTFPAYPVTALRADGGRSIAWLLKWSKTRRVLNNC